MVEAIKRASDYDHYKRIGLLPQIYMEYVELIADEYGKTFDEVVEEVSALGVTLID